MKIKKCFRCGKDIDAKSNFYSFTEFNNKKIINVNFAHRTCWEDFLKQMSNVDEAMATIRQLKGKLTEMGFLNPQEVIIKN